MLGEGAPGGGHSPWKSSKAVSVAVAESVQPLPTTLDVILSGCGLIGSCCDRMSLAVVLRTHRVVGRPLAEGEQLGLQPRRWCEVLRPPDERSLQAQPVGLSSDCVWMGEGRQGQFCVWVQGTQVQTCHHPRANSMETRGAADMWGWRQLLDTQMRYRGHIWTHGQGSGQRGVGRGAPGVAHVWDVFKT